jgi:anti-anti-sigma factor
MLEGMGHDAVGLVVDLSEVRHLDSAGIRMLHKLGGWLAQRRLELRVVVPKASSIRRVLELSCFDAHLPVTDSIDSAMAEIDCARMGLASPIT